MENEPFVPGLAGKGGHLIALEEVLDALKLQAGVLDMDAFRGQWRVVVDSSQLHATLKRLKEAWQFDMLVDITCVDYLQYQHATDRFGMVYLLACTERNQRLAIRVLLNEPNLVLPTVTDLWAGADWMEREVWDMFGIRFEGHSDLRRILMPEAFAAHPLRKDYPRQGRGERHNFPVVTRDQS